MMRVPDCELHLPPDAGDGVPVVVLLHGRGSNRHDLFGLRRQLPPAWAVVAPDAPFDAAPWGYGPGRAWYRYLGGTVPEPASFTASLDAVDALLRELPNLLGVAPGPVAVGGFSQGGTVSLGHALARGGTGHVLNFSGFLADHPEVQVSPETTRGGRLFWGHGLHDPAIPHAFAVDGRRLLRQADADLTAPDFPIGHWIDPGELAQAVAWLEAGFGR